VAAFVTVPGWVRRSTAPTTAASVPAAPAAPGRKIKAHSFHLADDGMRLTDPERDVASGEAPSSRPVVSRRNRANRRAARVGRPARYEAADAAVTERGEAFVDFSNELVPAFRGSPTSCSRR
jgi:hypothetical protein